MAESSSTSDLDNLWDFLLSRQPEQVRSAFLSLPENERQLVVAHLQRMASEPGWHPEQVISARAALLALQDRAVGAE